MQPYHILVAEDDEVDLRALRRAFARRGLADDLTVVHDGIEALAAIRRGLPEPFLLLLDQAMPRLTGLEVLRLLRADPAMAATEVYLMTTSRHPTEMAEAFRLGVRAFLNKEELGADYGPLFALLASHGRLRPMRKS